MIQTTHTAGPWRWYWDGRRVDLRTPDRGQLIILDGGDIRFARRKDSLGGLMVSAKNMFSDSHKSGFVEISNPDARLIEASPDLLEACKRVRRILDGPLSASDKWAAVNALNAAIAKASPQ